MGEPAAMFGLYIHWPFCKSKCPYCDFNSHVRDAVDQPRWRQALLAEMEQAAEGLGERQLTSIFFGGGTPSLMDPETTAALIARARALWPASAEPEITLEANPTSVEAGRFRAYAQAGVNRVSLGVQAMNDAALTELGREHSAREALSAVELAAEIFPRHSFDLIYARPGQTAEEWAAELEAALPYAGDHMSLYQLTIEPGTAFHTEHRLGRLKTPAEEEAARLYEVTAERMEAAGMPAYEISNHARPGGESRHNLVYWRYGDYVGLGPGAHGRESYGDSRYATYRHRLPEKWLEAVERDGHGLREAVDVAPEEQMREMLLMGLRLAEGVPESRMHALVGKGFSEALPQDRLRDLLEADYLTLAEGRLEATSEGRQRLNAVLGHLLA